jgi:DNA topoisomerase-3
LDWRPQFFAFQFVAQGLTVIQRNYLEVYIYEKWSDKEIIDYESVAEFEPSAIDFAESKTSPPNLLTEADLVADLVNPSSF